MRIVIVLILMTLIYSVASFGEDAAPVALAQVNVVVPDRSQAALSNALQIAFEKQMVHMSGDPKVMMLPSVQAASKNVTQWVQTYGYLEQLGQKPGVPPVLMLQVTFDQAALQKLVGDQKTGVNDQTILDRATVADQKIIDVVVTHIEDMKDLSSVSTALQRVYGVESVTPKDVQSDRATFEVKFKGDASLFENKMADDYRFRSSSKPLEYEWVGREP